MGMGASQSQNLYEALLLRFRSAQPMLPLPISHTAPALPSNASFPPHPFDRSPSTLSMQYLQCSF